jgi:hypothetical protein
MFAALRVRTTVGVLAFLMSCLVVIGASLILSGGAKSSVSFPSPDVQAKLVQAAREFAASNGDANASADYIVVGQRGVLVKGAMLGAELNSLDAAQDVFLVELGGSFVGYSMPRPAGVPPPHGRFLRVDFDAVTHEMLDWMIGDDAVKLDRLGDARPVITITR